MSDRQQQKYEKLWIVEATMLYDKKDDKQN